MPFYERQPYIQPLHQLLEEVMRGEIRVPRFQRPGTEKTWKPEQRRDLLDSLYRGFPVGTILLWSTTQKIGTMSEVGGSRIPAAEGVGQRPLRLLLDGHQRLSTLVAILGPGIASYDKTGSEGRDDEEWVFDLSRPKEGPSTQERILLLKAGQQREPHHLPLEIVFNRVTLNRWLREHSDLGPEAVDLADTVRDCFREYSMPVAVLAADSLDEATESFKRINSSGTPMSVFHMVTALAFRHDRDPLAEFAALRSEHIDPEGWGELGNSDLLRVCAGLLRPDHTWQHPAKLNIEKLASAVREDSRLVERTVKTVRDAGHLVRTNMGVHGPKALPYSWQLITLAIYLGTRAEGKLSDDEVSACKRWFWLTSYGTVFAGVNSSVYDRAAAALRDLVAGSSERAMDRDLTRVVGEVGRFDFRSARSTACALAMARQQDHGNCEGRAHAALAFGAGSLQTLFPKGKRSTWYHLAIVGLGKSIRPLRDALGRRGSGHRPDGDDEVLQGIGIGPAATGSLEDLIQLRRQSLLKDEQDFVESLGLKWQ